MKKEKKVACIVMIKYEYPRTNYLKKVYVLKEVDFHGEKCFIHKTPNGAGYTLSLMDTGWRVSQSKKLKDVLPDAEKRLTILKPGLFAECAQKAREDKTELTVSSDDPV